MHVKYVLVLNRTFLLVLGLFLAFFLWLFLGDAVAQDTRFIIWVFDKNVPDSQFGYYDGTALQATDPIYPGADIEGLSCLNNVIYAAGGLDGDAPSTLNTLVIDVGANTATLTNLADIHTADGSPFFEVVSLSARTDGTLWGYADMPPLRGIIQLDPASGVAELVVPFDKKVEAIAWIDNTLWLAGNNHFYRWTPGGSITAAFDVAGVNQIESLEEINGLLYAGVHKDDRGVIAIDPNTGAIVEGQGFPAPNDIEGLTFCPLQPVSTPTPTSTDTPTAANTATPTSMATDTATSTETAMATRIQSPAASTETPTSTVTPMATNTATPTPTDSQPGGQATPATPTPTATSTATPTVAPTPTLLAPTGLDETDEPDAPNATNLYLPLVVK